MPVPEKVTLELLPEEVKHLTIPEFEGAEMRCRTCGHLAALHNRHCCEFCMIEDCPCEWGEMPEEAT
jgi:hypothetical protein